MVDVDVPITSFMVTMETVASISHIQAAFSIHVGTKRIISSGKDYLEKFLGSLLNSLA